MSGTYDIDVFNIFKKMLNCFPKWLLHFIFKPARYQTSSSSTFSPTFDMVREFRFRF